MTEQNSFAAALVAAPQDTTSRLVFADWLAERADPRAGCIRLAVRLRASYGPSHPDHSPAFWRELGRGIEPVWWAEECRRLADEVTDKVGDGAKTAALVALALAEAGLLFRNDGDVATLIRDTGTQAVEAATRLTALAYSLAEVRRGLRTAALGTEQIAEPVLSAFERAGRDGCIHIEPGTVSPTGARVETSVQEGLRFPLDGLAEQEGRKLQPVAVLVSLRPLQDEDVRLALAAAQRLTAGLLCCGTELHSDAVERLRAADTDARVIVCSAAGGRWRDCFEDVAAATGARLIGADEERYKITARSLGRAGAARVEGGRLVIEHPVNTPDYRQRWIAHLRQLIEGTTGAVQEWHSLRLSQLAGSVVTLEVCGASPAETESFYGLACNALHAGRALIAEGYVPGGGAAYLRGAWHLEGGISQAVRWAMEEPCRALLARTRLNMTDALASLRADENLALDAVREELLPWRTDGPIDPIRVVRTVIESAFESACRALSSGHSTFS